MEKGESAGAGAAAADNSGALSLVDVAVQLVKSLLRDGCMDKEELRRGFYGAFRAQTGRGDAKDYLRYALRRLARAGEIVTVGEAVCRTERLARVIMEWGDLIDAMTVMSSFGTSGAAERIKIGPELRTNGRIITRLVRHGMLEALAAFICRPRLVTISAYVNDPVDLALVLDALSLVVPLRYLAPGVHAGSSCQCLDGDITLIVPRSAFLNYMATAAEVVVEPGESGARIRYVLELPRGPVTLEGIQVDCRVPSRNYDVLVPAVLELRGGGKVLRTRRAVLPLIINFVWVWPRDEPS
jgi:hypothetical protein